MESAKTDSLVKLTCGCMFKWMFLYQPDFFTVNSGYNEYNATLKKCSQLLKFVVTVYIVKKKI